VRIGCDCGHEILYEGRRFYKRATKAAPFTAWHHMEAQSRL
jgi:hypothetical protein